MQGQCERMRRAAIRERLGFDDAWAQCVATVAVLMPNQVDTRRTA